MSDQPPPPPGPAGGAGGQYPPAAPGPSYGPPPGQQPPQYGAPQYGAPQGPPPGQPFGAPPNYMPPMAGGRAKAGFGARFGAWFIDGLIVSAFSLPAIIALLNGEKEFYQCSSDLDETSSGAFICERPTSGTWGTFWVLMILAIVGAILYFGLMEGKGKTVGKRVAGISVVDQVTGQPIGTGRAIGRYFARIPSSFLCGLGYFWMLWDPNSQTWHDKIVSTSVVQD